MLLRYFRSLVAFERDARLFLVVTLVASSAISLYWVDFNLYLRSLGLSNALIGIVTTAASAAAMLAAFPASLLSDRIGRRIVMIGGSALVTIAFGGFLLTSSFPLLLLLAACYSAGQQVIQVVTSPFLVEHSRPDQRNELFSVQYAITSGTSVVAVLVGGFIAEQVAGAAGYAPQSPETYRVILLMMAALSCVGFLLLFRLGDDRRPTLAKRRVRREAGTESAVKATATAGGAASGAVAAERGGFARLLLPGFLIALGAGQVIPYLNVFVERKFGLQVASLNALFAVTSLGTMLAILLQPAVARRLGKIGAVVLMQGLSIPFLVVLGFSPVFWTVAASMAVRNSLMNAGSPIFNAFAMEHVPPGKRATLAAAILLLWSLGWVIAGLWYSLLQSMLGFDAGYAVNFATIIVLYSVATVLYWVWFGRDERSERLACANGAVATPGRAPGGTA